MPLEGEKGSNGTLTSCFPAPQQSSMHNPVHPKSKGTHSQVAVMNLAHCLNVKESTHHVPLKLTINLLFFPHESLNVLPTCVYTLSNMLLYMLDMSIGLCIVGKTRYKRSTIKCLTGKLVLACI